LVNEPFHHPDTFLPLLGYAKVCFHLPYRQTREGIAQGHAKGKAPSIPDYSTISRRINRLDIKTDEGKSMEFEDDCIVVAMDSTGVKVTNRGGQWVRDKRHAKRKGHLKIHMSVNARNRKVLSMKVNL
jgi:hypothetical protein